MTPVVLELSSVSKSYGALRPLRIERLIVLPGEQIAILGLDEPAAQVLINLITGASLPDSGDVRLLGRSTAEMVDSADWLATLDRFGIVSERAVLLESLSVVQNLAVPFSLEIEPPSDAVRQQAVALAHEVGVDEAVLERAVVDLSGAERVRVRLARALAFNPLLLLLEHPSAFVDRADVSRLGRDIRRIAERREAATIGLTVDRDFASAAASRVLSLDPATGGLSARR